MVINQQLKDLEELQSICEKEDDIQLKLNWNMLRSPKDSGNNHLYHYEKGILVGFLGLYGFGPKVELCGMVHPQYRNQGIFTRLFTNALKTIAELHYRQILLNTPANSESAKGFLKKIACDYETSEYQMKWSKIELDEDKGVTLRNATPSDYETEIQLDVDCFGFERNESDTYNKRVRKEPAQKFYIIEQDAKSVGKIRVNHIDGGAWIYGFAVFPELQGKGIGRKALKKVMIDEVNNGYEHIFLEVEAKNAHALKLYESCGFRSYNTQDYYRYNIK